MFSIDIYNRQSAGHHFIGHQGVVGSGKNESNGAFAVQSRQSLSTENSCMSDFHRDSQIRKIFLSEGDDFKTVT